MAENGRPLGRAGDLARDGNGVSPSTPGSPPRGLCAVGWLEWAVLGRDPERFRECTPASAFAGAASREKGRRRAPAFSIPQRERTVYRSCSVVDVAHTYMTVQARKIETMRPVAAVVEEIMRLLSRSGVCSDA